MTLVFLFILTYSIGSLDFSYNLNCKLQFFSYAHSLIRALSVSDYSQMLKFSVIFNYYVRQLVIFYV